MFFVLLVCVAKSIKDQKDLTCSLKEKKKTGDAVGGSVFQPTVYDLRLDHITASGDSALMLLQPAHKLEERSEADTEISCVE